MGLTKLEKNKIYEAIKTSSLNPNDFRLEDDENRMKVKHNTGQTFAATRRSIVDALLDISVRRDKYFVEAFAPGLTIKTSKAVALDDIISGPLAKWLNAIRLTVGVPDYWEEMQRGRAMIVDIQGKDSSNAPFSEDERKQVAALLWAAWGEVSERLNLTSKQIEQIRIGLHEADEATERMGRKDWLLLFGGTILNLIVTDTVTPEVAGHIFTTVVQGIVHLFGGPPPSLMS
jgi:hypothetical protein